jgi:hypothetical protein
LIIVYTPADGEPEHYDATSLKVSEASIVQRTVDMKWQDILKGLQVDDLDAMRGIVWAIKKRSQPTIRYGDFDPGVTEMTTRMDNREVELWVEQAFATADDELDAETMARVLLSRMPDVAADPDHARAVIEAKARVPKDPESPEPEAVETEPEDSSPSPTSSEPASTTSDSSPTSSTSPPSS